MELAQLEYQLPRLTRLWTHLSRTQGGIGSRGPGESQLETDRRIIRERIKKMKAQVEDVRQQRQTTARGPRPAPVPDHRDRRLHERRQVDAAQHARRLRGRPAEDKLFATLDPTSRQVKLGDGQTAIVTDTVGFIHKLPHQLVDAFRATLEEVTRADVLVEVVDASDDHATEHRATVQTVLDELGAGDKPRLTAFNKADLLYPGADGDRPAPAVAGSVLVSASTGFGLDALRGEMAALLASLWEDVDVEMPYAAGELLARVRERGTVELEYGERSVRVHGRMAPSMAGELRAVAGRWQEIAGVGGRGVLSDAHRDQDRGRSLRRAGTGPDGDGRPRLVVGRGRQARPALAGDDPADGAGLRHALLLETAPDGSFSHLELATPAGLLTLHPEGDGTLHGNVGRDRWHPPRRRPGLGGGRGRRHRGVAGRRRGLRTPAGRGGRARRRRRAGRSSG